MPVGPAGAREVQERRVRVGRAGGLLGAVLAVGTIGYSLLTGGAVSLLDCLYMTVITISTVGFKEAVPIAGDSQLTVFTIALVLAGSGSVLYFFTSLTVLLVEGDLLYSLWRHRMEQAIKKLSDHVIVAGAGRSGWHVISELHENKIPTVVIENDEQKAERVLTEFNQEIPVILGDAMEDDRLREAGIENARGLVAALAEDRDNLFLCLSARQLRAGLRIVARVVDHTNTGKFLRVGVNSVVSPALLGGRRLAYEIVHPAVVSFVDTLQAPASDDSIHLAELGIDVGSSVAGKKLREANLRALCSCLVIGVRRPEGDRYRYNPSPDEVLEPGGTLLALGSRDELDALRELVRAPA